MPALPAQLTQAIIQAISLQELITPAQRRGWLMTAIGADSPNYRKIEMAGAADDFAAAVIAKLTHKELCKALRALEVGVNHANDIEALCDQIEAHQLNPIVNGHANPVLAVYRHKCIDRWVEAHKLDKQFVRLIMLRRDEQRGYVQPENADEYNDLRKLLADTPTPALVLLGVPGSGKSTLLRRLQLDCEQDYLQANGEKLTFYAALNRYPADASDPLAWLGKLWQSENPDLLDFESLLRAGRLLLLLDALNEMRHRDQSHYEDKVNQWREFIRNLSHHGNRAVFTCRSLNYSVSLGSEETPVTQASIKPMTLGLINEFLQARAPAHAPSIIAPMRNNAKLAELYSTPYFLSLLADLAQDGGGVPQGQAALFTRFMRAALRREVAERQNPRLLQPGLLAQRDRDWINNSNAWRPDYKLPEIGALVPRLMGLAYTMQQRGQGTDGGQVSLAVEDALALLGPDLAEAILQAATSLNVLDEDQHAGEVKFFHQLLQEYFAARQLARQPNPALVQQVWRADEVRPNLADTLASLPSNDPLPPLPSSGWEESTYIAAAMSAAPDDFVRGLMPYQLPLAGRIAAQTELRFATPSKAQLQTALLGRMHDPAADLRARIAAGLALGQLGDPRLSQHTGPHGRYLLPLMVKIAAGDYWIGEDNSLYADEKPAHRVSLAAFEMATLPVSNAEYACFMAAGGYDDERWWRSEAAKRWRSGESVGVGPKQQWRENRATFCGWSEAKIRGLTATPKQIEYYLTIRNWSEDQFEAWLDEHFPTGKALRQPSEWDNPDFNNPAQPLVGVCWHEACAYCAWLSAQTKRRFRLPSEAEWEAAAARTLLNLRGLKDLGGLPPKRREYAYEGEFDPLRGNTFESHIRKTTPVGLYLEGATPDGIFDLTGNVWEWTSSIYANYPYIKEDGRENPNDENKPRAVRGGAWSDLSNGARAVYRNGVYAAFHSSYNGFRLVV